MSGGNKPPAKLVGGTLARLGHADSRCERPDVLHALNVLLAMVGKLTLSGVFVFMLHRFSYFPDALV